MMILAGRRAGARPSTSNAAIRHAIAGAAGQRIELVNTNLSKEQEARLHDVFAE